jgi:protease I
LTPTVGVPEHAAVLVTDGYLDLEFWYPVLRLREAGVDVAILGPEADSTFHSTLGYPVVPDRSTSDAAEHCDLVVIPGGAAADRLAGDKVAIALLTSLAGDGARVVTVGRGALVAAAANVPVEAQCEDADGLPQLFRTLLGAQ